MRKQSNFRFRIILKNLFNFIFLYALLSLIGGFVGFLRNNIDSKLIVKYILLFSLTHLFRVLPAIFFLTIFFAISTSFPDKVIDELKIKTKDITRGFISTAIFFLLIIIIVLELVSPVYLKLKDKVYIKNQRILYNKENELIAYRLLREAKRLLNSNLLKESFFKTYEIFLYIPDFKPADELLKILAGKIKRERKKRIELTLEEGIKLFKEKRYREAAKNFKIVLEAEPENKTAERYLNVALQRLNISEQRFIREVYTEKIKLLKENFDFVMKERKILKLIEEIKELRKQKKLKEAYLKAVEILYLEFDRYEGKKYVKELRNEIRYYNSLETSKGKIKKKNLVFYAPERKIILFANEVRKANLTSFIFINNTIFIKGKIYKKKYGFKLPGYKNGYHFINDIYQSEKPLEISIPAIFVWNLPEIITTPEFFSFALVNKYKELINTIDTKIYTDFLVKKFLYYIWSLIFLLLSIYLGYKFRMREEKKFLTRALAGIPFSGIVFISFYFIYRILIKIYQILF